METKPYTINEKTEMKQTTNANGKQTHKIEDEGMNRDEDNGYAKRESKKEIQKLSTTTMRIE